MARGFDFGTMLIVSAKKNAEGNAELKSERNCFFDVSSDFEEMISSSNYNYIKDTENGEERLYILGKDALKLANLYAKNDNSGDRKSGLRRPMQNMVINSKSEKKALQMLKYLSQSLIGKPDYEGEVAVISIPSDPLSGEFNNTFHSNMCQQFIRELGYDVVAINEALAVVYATNPTTKDEDGEELQMTGIGISWGAGGTNGCLAYKGKDTIRFALDKCLSKDFLVQTVKGIKKISEISIGEEVISENGEYVKVVDVVNNGHREKLKRLIIDGVSFTNLDFTEDHKILIKKKNNWVWDEIKNIRIGDIVGEPVIKHDFKDGTFYLGYDSNDEKQLRQAKTKKLGQTIGMFLGDGSAFIHKDRKYGLLNIAFNSKDIDLIKKYEEIFKIVFDRKCSKVIEGNCTCFIVNHTTCAKYFKEKFYNNDKDKIFPFKLNEITDQMAIGIIEGLLDSDGNKNKKGGYAFYNTSLDLIMLMKNLLNRFNIQYSICKRGPRIGGINNRGKQIIGRKDSYTLKIGALQSKMLDLLFEWKSPIDDERLAIKYGSEIKEYVVSDIIDIDYNDDVYDLKIGDESHSFTGVGVICHNCGDWIDSQVSSICNMTSSEVTIAKEKLSKEGKLDLSAPCYDDDLTSGLYIYYKNLVETVIRQFKQEFIKQGTQFSDPIEVIVSGGTSKPNGFEAMVEQAINDIKWPFEIKGVRRAKDPLCATALGCLAAAESKEKKKV